MKLSIFRTHGMIDHGTTCTSGTSPNTKVAGWSPKAINIKQSAQVSVYFQVNIMVSIHARKTICIAAIILKSSRYLCANGVDVFHQMYDYLACHRHFGSYCVASGTSLLASQYRSQKQLSPPATTEK